MVKLNLGSGQRPFKSPWLNVDIRDQGYPVDVLTINKYGFTWTKRPEDLNPTDKIVDVGYKTFIEIKKKIKSNLD